MPDLCIDFTATVKPVREGAVIDREGIEAHLDQHGMYVEGTNGHRLADGSVLVEGQRRLGSGPAGNFSDGIAAIVTDVEMAAGAVRDCRVFALNAKLVP